MAIVRNIKTNDLYRYNGENSFTNIRTGVSGKVTDEAARTTFVINVDATIIMNEYPMVEKMIKALNLKSSHELLSNTGIEVQK
jgi:hypothetical protein